MKILYIIGNGFDLNQGLPTSYAHFYEYYFQLASECSEPATKLRQLLIKELYDKRTDKWKDLEETLGKVTKDFDSETEFEAGYLDIYTQLMNYLKRAYDNSILVKFENIENTLYKDLALPWLHLAPREQNMVMNYIPQEDIHISVINYNYTDTFDKISDLPSKVGKSIGRYDGHNVIYDGCLHIHHKLKNKDIILGVDNINQIANEKFRNSELIRNYLIKPQTNMGLGNLVDTKCSESIQKAKVICIYGMSLGQTDMTWWKEIGKRLKADNRVILLYFPFYTDISKKLPIELTNERNKFKRDICEQIGVPLQEIHQRVFVEFCNKPASINIFANTKRKDVNENFENVMASFQEEGIINKPQRQVQNNPFHFDLEPPLKQEPLFVQRIYKKTNVLTSYIF